MWDGTWSKIWCFFSFWQMCTFFVCHCMRRHFYLIFTAVISGLVCVRRDKQSCRHSNICIYWELQEIKSIGAQYHLAAEYDLRIYLEEVASGFMIKPRFIHFKLDTWHISYLCSSTTHTHIQTHTHTHTNTLLPLFSVRKLILLYHIIHLAPLLSTGHMNKW